MFSEETIISFRNHSFAPLRENINVSFRKTTQKMEIQPAKTYDEGIPLQKPMPHYSAIPLRQAELCCTKPTPLMAKQNFHIW